MTILPAAAARLTTARACLLAALVWAAIYLPALGSLEIKGEEGRRILPAVAMLDTGRWIVPQVGGVPYLSKPPLINWLVAAAFRVSGTRSEWAARAPSVLAVLALALTTVGTLSAFLTPAGALLAAIFLLTNIGLMEKGRLAEIEALYLSLYGIALCLWLGAWQRDAATGAKPSWRTWTLPWFFLGFGLLTKGPLHLLFFYGIVVAILGCARRWRDLWNPAHLVGVVLMLGIFALWAVPYLRQTAANGAGGVWLAQFQGRMEVNDTFRLQNWLLNIPRGLVNYLPWTVLLPLAWRRSPPSVTPDASARLRHLARPALGGGGMFSRRQPRSGRTASLHAAPARARERSARVGDAPGFSSSQTVRPAPAAARLVAARLGPGLAGLCRGSHGRGGDGGPPGWPGVSAALGSRSGNPCCGRHDLGATSSLANL